MKEKSELATELGPSNNVMTDLGQVTELLTAGQKRQRLAERITSHPVRPYEVSISATRSR